MEPLGRGHNAVGRYITNRRNCRLYYSVHQAPRQRPRIRRAKNQNSPMITTMLLICAIIVAYLAILGQNKPIDGAENQQQQQQNEQHTAETSKENSGATTSDNSEQTTSAGSNKKDSYVLSGWTKVSKMWPPGEIAYFIASQKGHHFITTKLPKEVVNRKSKVMVSVEFYYNHKNVEPVLSFVPCSNKHDMRSNGNLFAKEEWSTFSYEIDSKECKDRDEIEVDVLLHDGGDIFAWKAISLTELPNSPPESSNGGNKPKKDGKPNDNADDKSGDKTQAEKKDDQSSTEDKDTNGEGKKKDDASENLGEGPNQNVDQNKKEDQNQDQNKEENQNQDQDPNKKENQNQNQDPNKEENQNQDQDPNKKENQNQDQDQNKKENQNQDQDQNKKENQNQNQDPNKEENQNQDQDPNKKENQNQDQDQNTNDDSNIDNHETGQNNVKSPNVDNQHHSDNQHKQPSQPVKLYKIQCDPKLCDKKQFDYKRFRPMVHGLPRGQDYLMKGGQYLINNGDKPLKIKLKTEDNLSTHDICLDANIFMDKGTKLFLRYPHTTKEPTKSTELVSSDTLKQQSEASGNGDKNAGANDSAKVQPTGGKFESSQSKENVDSSPAAKTSTADAAQTNPISPQATQSTSTDTKNHVYYRTITEIAPPEKSKPQWIRRKMCVSEYLPRLDFGDESGDKELILEPKAGPNDIIGIQFHSESGVAFNKQLTSLSFMPNLNTISKDDVQEFWKANGGNVAVFEPSDETGTGTGGDRLATRNKQLKIDNIMSQQESFELISRWLKLNNDQADRVKFNLTTKNEDWIKSVDIGIQQAGANWSMTNVFEKDPNIKKEEIDLPISIEKESGIDEFRVKIRYNLTEEAKSSSDARSLTITSLAIGDPCIDEDYCQNNGVCKAIGTSQAQCECPQGYTGERCEIINPCEVLYDGRSGKFICESIKAQCIEKIPVLRCIWPNDEYLECKATVVNHGNNNPPSESPLQDGKELTSDQMKLKIAEQSKLIIIMGALMAALSLFAIVIIGNLVMRLLGAKKRIKTAEEAREMSSRLGERRTTGVPKYGRPAAASFQNQAFDD